MEQAKLYQLVIYPDSTGTNCQILVLVLSILTTKHQYGRTVLILRCKFWAKRNTVSCVAFGNIPQDRSRFMITGREWKDLDIKWPYLTNVLGSQSEGIEKD